MDSIFLIMTSKPSNELPDPKLYLCDALGNLLDWYEVFTYLIDLTKKMLEFYERKATELVNMKFQHYRQILYQYWGHDEGDVRYLIKCPKYENFRKWIVEFEGTMVYQNDPEASKMIFFDTLMRNLVPNRAIFEQILLRLIQVQAKYKGQLRGDQNTFLDWFKQSRITSSKEYYFTFEITWNDIKTLQTRFAYAMYKNWDIESLNTRNEYTVVRICTMNRICYFYRKQNDDTLTLYKPFMKIIQFQKLDRSLNVDGIHEFGTIDLKLKRFCWHQYPMYEDIIKITSMEYLMPQLKNKLNPCFLTVSESHEIDDNGIKCLQIQFKYTTDKTDQLQTNLVDTGKKLDKANNELTIWL